MSLGDFLLLAQFAFTILLNCTQFSLQDALFAVDIFRVRAGVALLSSHIEWAEGESLSELNFYKCAWWEGVHFKAWIESPFQPEGFRADDGTDKKSGQAEDLMSSMAVCGQRRLLPFGNAIFLHRSLSLQYDIFPKCSIHGESKAASILRGRRKLKSLSCSWKNTV